MHLVDINVWLGLAFQRHVHHTSASAWFGSVADPCCFCRFTQMGFLRLASNPSVLGPAAVSMSEAWRAYDILAGDPKVTYMDEPEGIDDKFRELTQSTKFSPKVWNDAYLAAFAELAGLEVVTFDKGFASYRNLRYTLLT